MQVVKLMLLVMLLVTSSINFNKSQILKNLIIYHHNNQNTHVLTWTTP